MNSPVLIFGILFILIGVFSGLFFLARAIRAMNSRHWPRTSGELDAHGLRRVAMHFRPRDRFSALQFDFAYRYRVDGKTYTGRRVTFSDSTIRTRKALDRILDDYRHTKHIIVYYNPKNPAESVLIPGATFQNFGPMITSALFVAAGLYLAVFMP